MIKFNDKEIQNVFNECHFRQELEGVDICRGMCQPCGRIIGKGQCEILKEYFNNKKETDDDNSNNNH